MITTQQPVLRRFWYAVAPLSHLETGCKPFTLLGEKLVLWLDKDGQPAAAIDRCCHRTAKLSAGSVTPQGDIMCPYHGWTYNRTGRCTKVPQDGDEVPNSNLCVKAYSCRAKYGYAWVCLEDNPLADIPSIPEADQPGMRQVPEFYELWKCAGLRLMENSFDNAHFAFVHMKSFGDSPIPSKLELTEHEGGFLFHSEVPVKNPETAKKALATTEDFTVRIMDSEWFLPFGRKLKITYPNGLIHIINTHATPIDDQSIMVLQWVYRNDTEADVPAKDIVAFDRQVTDEDRAVLETTEWDVPVDLTRRAELHMACDKPGMVMRKQLMELLRKHGEVETMLS
jgi:phenylpropionate dioxygenase-like ring-hydroxylating dioxygenase large terminal subunit